MLVLLYPLICFLWTYRWKLEERRSPQIFRFHYFPMKSQVIIILSSPSYFRHLLRHAIHQSIDELFLSPLAKCLNHERPGLDFNSILSLPLQFRSYWKLEVVYKEYTREVRNLFTIGLILYITIVNVVLRFLISWCPRKQFHFESISISQTGVERRVGVGIYLISRRVAR